MTRKAEKFFQDTAGAELGRAFFSAATNRIQPLEDYKFIVYADLRDWRTFQLERDPRAEKAAQGR